MTSAKKRAPTVKQLRVAKGIAKHQKVPLPEWVLKDRKACKQFIDFCQRNLPPTRDQLQRLSDLGEVTGFIPPDDVVERQYLTFMWILAVEHVVLVTEYPSFVWEEGPDDRAPTDAMISYAKLLANEQGLALPERVQKEKAACHAFIRHCLSLQPPTEKMVEAVDSYLEDLGVIIPEALLMTKISTKLLLKILSRLKDFQKGIGSELP
ncbi:hypothetical protein HLV39_05340 [Marinobacter adhaerens]|uniref:Uncharacterized protein n=1 Tax=Marinobacter adhaerens TaxID=1033846 RepID=A0A851HVB3_9GAMM|nr:hypothetical protein [Marinobacter adhaerens]NWN90915.1 hypothetical protein [Marinobacter adhaerens]